MLVNAYTGLVVAKLLAVLVFAGGVGAALLARDAATRHVAVHRVASPALLATWVVGYLLLRRVSTPLSELWPLAGLVFSLIAMLALIQMTSRDRAGATSTVVTLACLAVVVAAMVLRPTWGAL